LSFFWRNFHLRCNCKCEQRSDNEIETYAAKFEEGEH